jgi:hypothetical protein
MDPTTLAAAPRSERVQRLFGFDPFDYQADLLDYDPGPVAKAAVKPGRQTGKTVTGGAIAADAFVGGHDVMILAPYEDTVAEMMGAFKSHVNTLRDRLADVPAWDFPLGTENVMEWTHPAGGRCRARTVGTDGTQIRGKNPDVVLVDEASYIKDRVYTEVIEPFFSTHDEWEFYLFSTPAGRSGYFFDAVEGERADEWYSPHWPTSISPLVADSFLKRKRRQLDSLTFKQEYRGEFVDDSELWIPLDLFDTVTTDDTTRPPHKAWYLGVDVARKGRDRTVYLLLDEDGLVRDISAEETSTVPGVADRIAGLCRQHDIAEVYVDENAVGGGVVDSRDIASTVTGVTFTTQTKHDLYTGLKTAFEEGAITIPSDVEHFRRLKRETTSLQFGFTANGYVQVSHPPNGHDDFPDALALAQYARVGGETSDRATQATISW